MRVIELFDRLCEFGVDVDKLFEWFFESYILVVKHPVLITQVINICR